MIAIGIDPGVSGALVLLDEELQPVEWIRMPTLKVGKSSRVDSAAVARWVLRAVAPPRPRAHVFIELVASMPGQGVSSSFTFGHALGSVVGVCGALMLPVTYLAPQVWKKRVELIGKDKDAGRSRAIQLWPHWSELEKKGAGQALGEAALIALCGVHGSQGGEEHGH